MKKILISLSQDTINLRYKIDKTREDKDLTRTLMNTNVISNDELIFSDAYLKNNVGLMCSFLTEIVKEKKISKLVIEESDIVLIALDIFKDIKYITKLYITSDTQVSYKIYEKLLLCDYLKYVNCFEIPSFMLEKLTDNGMVVDIRCEIVSISNFVYQNNLINYTKLYYRKTIKIFSKLNDTDLGDFETFCQINRNLRTIYIYDFDISMIENICKILSKTKKKNVRVLIYQNLDNTSLINDSMKKLKLFNKFLIKECDSKLKIIYGMDYISRNFVKQLSITNIKTCLLIVILLELVVFASVKLNNYKTKKNIDDLQDISNEIGYTFEEFGADETVLETENTEVISEEETIVATPYNTRYEESFDKLLSINSDTRAWLRVNNTSINYPVVQGTDNDFYLNHDYNRDDNLNGWIFIDYRNDMENLDQNTIMYGHNTRGTTMFATLRYVLQESWYNNSENLDIVFNTPEHQYRARIFSVYVIPNTNDYLYINFSDEDYFNFINMIKSRSIHDFGVDFTTDDKMITLSTCNNNGDKRLVVHAKLIEI